MYGKIQTSLVIKCLVLFLYKSAVRGGSCQNFQFDDDDDDVDDDDDENGFFLQNG